MLEWCCLAEEIHQPSGQYLRSDLETLGNTDLHTIDSFIEALALKIMEQYESINHEEDNLEVLDPELLEPVERTKKFYYRLFDDDGNCTCAFRTEASETLAMWIEYDLSGAVAGYRGRMHNNDPVFDGISIIPVGDTYALRIVQVKATKSRLQPECSGAILRFRDLLAHECDAELTYVLSLIERKVRAATGMRTRDIRNELHFRVTALSQPSLNTGGILTTYDSHVSGEPAQRTFCLVPVQWDKFWEELARVVYEKLS